MNVLGNANSAQNSIINTPVPRNDFDFYILNMSAQVDPNTERRDGFYILAGDI